MVDLVKLRKKAKKAAADSELNGEQQAAAEANAAAKSDSASNRASLDDKAIEVRAETGAADAGARQPVAAQRQATAPASDRAAEPAGDAAAVPAEAATPASPQTSSKLERFKQEAGRLRDVARVASEESREVEAQVELLLFVMGDESYAIEIEHIVEIVTPRAVTRVPNADPSIVGIISLRGTVVTLLDVRSRLQQRELERTEETRVVVLEHERQNLGFEVDRVFRVVKVTAREIEPHPVVHASESDESIRGVFRHEGALTILLDLDKLLAGGHRNLPSGVSQRLASRA